MKFTILYVFLISTCRAQQDETIGQRTSRTPQGHVQYSDPDGLRVNWRHYAPNTQWESLLEIPQRDARAESGTAQPRLSTESDSSLAMTREARAEQQQPVQQEAQQIQVQYKPFSMVPMHIKQLLLHMYKPQEPYVDPSVYIYHGRQLQQQQQQQQEEYQEERKQASAEQEESAQTSAQSQYSTGLYEHIPKFHTKYTIGKSKLGYVKYKNEQSATEVPRYGSIPERQDNFAQEHEQQQDDGMPKAIHQLLTLQAQTPYHVIADRIVYKPKTIFVPKPFTVDSKGPYKYRSKVYYYKNDGYEADNKERSESGQHKEQEEEE